MIKYNEKRTVDGGYNITVYVDKKGSIISFENKNDKTHYMSMDGSVIVRVARLLEETLAEFKRG